MPIFSLPPVKSRFLGDASTPDVTTYTLSDGLAGNRETVDFMRKVAHDRKGDPRVRKLALEILHRARVKSMNYIDESLAIGSFVKDQVRYVKDAEGIEQLHDPVYLIQKIREGRAQGDCDDMALLIATLLLSVGHEPSFRMVRYQHGTPHFNHIYVVDYDKNWGEREKSRVVLDAILKAYPIGTEVPHASGEEVLV